MRFLVANFPSYLKLAITMISNGLIFPPRARRSDSPKQLN